MIQLLHGDCLELMIELDDKYFKIVKERINLAIDENLTHTKS